MTKSTKARSRPSEKKPNSRCLSRHLNSTWRSHPPAPPRVLCEVGGAGGLERRRDDRTDSRAMADEVQALVGAVAFGDANPLRYPQAPKLSIDVIGRGIFTSVKDLGKKLMRYIRQYNKNPRTVKWKYYDPSRRITTDSVDTVH